MPAFDFEDTLGNDPAMIFDVNNKRPIAALYKNGTKVFELCADGFIYSTSGWAKRFAAIGLGDFAANNDAYKYPLIRAMHDVEITGVWVGVDTTRAANATDYQSLNVYKSTSSTALGTALTTASVALTAGEAREIASLDSTLRVLKAGETLYLKATKASSGATLSGVVVTVEYEIKRPIAAPSATEALDNVFRLIAGGGGTDGLFESDHEQRSHLIVRQAGVDALEIDVDGKMHGDAPDQIYYQCVNIGDIVEADGGAKKCILLKPHCDIEVQRVYFGQTEDSIDADDDTNHLQVKITDSSDNLLTDGFIQGPYGGGTDMDGGLLYDMGDINPQYKKLTSSEDLRVQFDTLGTLAATVKGLTLVVAYKKTA